MPLPIGGVPSARASGWPGGARGGMVCACAAAASAVTHALVGFASSQQARATAAYIPPRKTGYGRVRACACATYSTISPELKNGRSETTLASETPAMTVRPSLGKYIELARAAFKTTSSRPSSLIPTTVAAGKSDSCFNTALSEKK